MTDLSVTENSILKELDESLTQFIEEAEKRRQSASAKNENYKIEFAQGEKQAYENISKTIKTVLAKG